jgi:hypothetical protein
MWKFNKQTVKETVVNSGSLASEIDGIVNAFTTMITNLQNKSAEANSLKLQKEEEIAALTKECNNLANVSARATKLANNISKIFDEDGSQSDC